MKSIIVLLSVILFSCNSKKEGENLCDLSSRILIKENYKYNLYLSENIRNQIEENKTNEKLLRFDNLTSKYLEYLAEIESEISSKTTKIFFENDNYSKKGKEFIKVTKIYKAEIEKLTINENLKKRMNLVLNMNDIQMPEKRGEIPENNETAEIKVRKTYFKYLDYNYRDFTKNQSLVFLLNKKRSILEIENEFIQETINSK